MLERLNTLMARLVEHRNGFAADMLLGPTEAPTLDLLLVALAADNEKAPVCAGTQTRATV